MIAAGDIVGTPRGEGVVLAVGTVKARVKVHRDSDKPGYTGEVFLLTELVKR